MTTTSTSPVFLVDAYSDPICLKILGRANYLNCGPLNDLFTKIIEKNRKDIVVDFTECSGMDSTFLGLLVNVSLEFKKSDTVKNIFLCNVKGRNLELIENLGLNFLIEVNSHKHILSQSTKVSTKNLETLDIEGAASPEAILKAHEGLVKANPSNLSKFQDVISFLKNLNSDNKKIESSE